MCTSAFIYVHQHIKKGIHYCASLLQLLLSTLSLLWSSAVCPPQHPGSSWEPTDAPHLRGLCSEKLVINWKYSKSRMHVKTYPAGHRAQQRSALQSIRRALGQHHRTLSTMDCPPGNRSGPQMWSSFYGMVITFTHQEAEKSESWTTESWKLFLVLLLHNTTQLWILKFILLELVGLPQSDDVSSVLKNFPTRILLTATG